MAREFAKAFYDSAAWRKCRTAFIAERQRIDGGMCQRCGQELGYIVHHRVWLSPENIGDHNVTLNHKNLEYVCHVCHNKIEQGEEEPRYRFTPDGQVEGYPPPFREGGWDGRRPRPEVCAIYRFFTCPPSPKSERSN